MKQKRKAKSLFSSKIGLNGIGIISLLGILGGVLCLASIGLQNRSVIAAEGDISTMKLDYDGVNDEVEVVYGVSFLKEGENNVVLSNIYKEGSTVYLSPNSVAVNPQIEGGKPDPAGNKVEQGVYGHVLGGEWNKLSSANVTIIAGNSNIVEVGNANATVLGGKQNVLKAGNQDRTAILVGGFENHILNSNKGVSIIGGENNYVQGSASNVTILGGKGNVVEGSNAIVGGSNVGVPDDVTNIFAFSDKTAGLQISAEQGKGSDSFYLNVENGVGINTEPTTNGVETSGAVEFGDIDVTNTCGDDNYGVQGTWNGCLVGCTLESGKDGGKWELLDSSENCEEKLCGDPKDPNIVCPGPVNCEIHPESEECKCKIHPELEECKSRCVGSLVVDNERMNICVDRYGNNLDITKYYRTDFEKVLIDSDEPCPDQDGGKEELKSLKDNQCVYKCKEGYHLFDNKIEGYNLPTGSVGCYEDCKLPWSDEKIKHGEKRTGYSNNEVYCAYTADTPKSEDTCANYKASLLCVNGTLYVADANGKPTVKNTAYTLGSCTLGGFSCNTSDYNYNLRQSTITAGWKYPETGVSNWKIGDRNTAYGTRGEYKACIDFKPTANTNEDCDENGSDPYHYQLTKCKNGYSTGADFPYECRGVCYAGSEEYLDGQTKVGYVSSSVTCPLPVPNPNAKCEAVTYTCVDGHWKDSAGNENTSPIRSCSTISTDPCSGYTIPWTRVSELINVGYLDQGDYYKYCTSNVKTYDGKGCSENQKYKFDCSSAGYSSHSISLLGGYGMEVCVQDPECGSTHYNCSAGTSSENNGPYVVTGTLADGSVWEGTGYDWKCSSKYDFVTVDCKEVDKGDPVNGVCGDTKDGCSKGRHSDLTDSDTEYKWECKGINGGKSSGTCTSPKPYCGDGIKNNGEDCDYNDSSKSGWGANGCSTSCKPVNPDEPYCGDGIKNNGEECDYNDSSKSGWGANGCSTSCKPVNPDEYQCIGGFAGASVYGQSDQSLDKNYYSVLLDSQRAQQQVAAGAKCVYVCNSPFGPVDTNEDGKYDNCQNPTPSIHKCTDIPDNAKEIKGIGNSKENVKSTLYADEASVPSDAKCAYVCDDNYHKDGNECKENSYKCTDIPSNADQVNGIGNSKEDVKSTLYENKKAAGTTKCAYICKSGYHKDGSECKPDEYQCTKKPANAIEVNGIGDSKKDVESTLIAYNKTSSDPCVYKCDRDNNYFYYPDLNKCQKLSDACTSTKYGCSSPAVASGSKQQDGYYIWECRADGIKVGETCKKEIDSTSCSSSSCDSSAKIDWNGDKFEWQEGRIYTSSKTHTTDANALGIKIDTDGKMHCTNIVVRGDGTTRCRASGIKSAGTYYLSICGKWYSFKVQSLGGGTYNGEYFSAGNYVKPSDLTEVGNLCKAKENGKCAFDGTYCSKGTRGDVSYIGSIGSYIGKYWTCKGEGGGSDQACRLQWECGGSCQRATEDGGTGWADCADMYKQYETYGSGDCQNAGMYFLFKTKGGEPAGRNTCYRNNPVSTHPYDLKCSDLTQYYRNHLDIYVGGGHACLKWIADVKCYQQVGGDVSTFEGNDAVKACSAINTLKPSCASTSYWSFDNLGDRNVGSTCKVGGNGELCAIVYKGTTPVINTFVASGTDTTGINNYCYTKKNEDACKSVKVVKYMPGQFTDLYTSPSWLTDEWKKTNAGKRTEYSCCTWK